MTLEGLLCRSYISSRIIGSLRYIQFVQEIICQKRRVLLIPNIFHSSIMAITPQPRSGRIAQRRNLSRNTSSWKIVISIMVRAAA